jgi:hypothetical protein
MLIYNMESEVGMAYGPGVADWKSPGQRRSI